MVTSNQLFKKYGSPLDDLNTLNKNEQHLWEYKNMMVINVPNELREDNKILPKKLYGHKDFIPTVLCWLNELKRLNLLDEINEWNGIFMIRTKRGLSSLSLHAWGMALDVNAKNNPLGWSREKCIKNDLKPFSEEFISLSRNYFDCGADWISRPDLMHFQVKEI